MPRKVVFVNRFFHPDLSATSQMLSDLAFRLAQSGVDVHVISSRLLYENAAANLRPRERVHGVEVHRVWTARFGRGSLLGRALDYATFYVTASTRLLLLLRAGDVAVVKTDPPMLSIPASIAVFLRGAQLVNWLQDVFPEIASRLQIKAIPRPIEVGLQALRDRSLRFARANVVLGTRMRDLLRARDIDADRFQIIENWADSAAIQPRPVERSELRVRLGLAGRFVVAYSGNLGRAHEYDTILAAAEALRDDPTFVFLMIGGGAKVQALQRCVTRRQLTNFCFAPYQPREALADSMAAADVHWVSLLPELEGLIVPSKVYGILAAGRPTIFIGDPAGEVAQLLREGDCGITVEVGAGERLAAELRSLARDPERVAALGRRARAIFERRFTLEAAANRWLELLSPECRTVGSEESQTRTA